MEYRLAPDARATAIVQEAYEAFGWLREHATELALDAQRLAVGGDSAGGNLAIAVALRCVRERQQTPACQVLFYPITDWRFLSDSYREFAGGYFLTAPGMLWFREHFLDAPGQASDPLLSPLLSSELGALPASLVITAGFDPLRDEGGEFADLLESAGVPVRHICYQDVIHAFISFAGGISQGMDALEEAGRFLRERLA